MRPLMLSRCRSVSRKLYFLRDRLRVIYTPLAHHQVHTISQRLRRELVSKRKKKKINVNVLVSYACRSRARAYHLLLLPPKKKKKLCSLKLSVFGYREKTARATARVIGTTTRCHAAAAAAANGVLSQVPLPSVVLVSTPGSRRADRGARAEDRREDRPREDVPAQGERERHQETTKETRADRWREYEYPGCHENGRGMHPGDPLHHILPGCRR